MRILELALGALLHDVGKFSQRAHGSHEGLSPQSVGMTSSLCPTGQYGGPTHKHVLYTNEFMETLPYLPEGLDKSRVANLASYHHRPDSADQEIITQADRLSSGMERYPSDDDATGPQKFRRVRLLSVASTLSVPDAPATEPVQLPLTVLQPATAFPLENPQTTDLTPEYRTLWDRFVSAWGENRCTSPLAFINRAATILERYTWCIPSATNVLPDISLFDHLKTTAALAVCLAEAGPKADKPFLLVGGDLNGIQKYIFDVRQGSGGLARRLRARSFAVSAFMESVSSLLLDKLGFPLTQRILFAGGKFHVLLPNTARCREALQSVRKQSTQWLFDYSAGDVALTLAELEMAAEDLKSFSDSVTLLNARLRAARDRAGDGVLCDEDGWATDRFVLPGPGVSAAEELCTRCQRRRGTETQSHDDVVVMCDECHAEERLGALLPTARYVAFYRDKSVGHVSNVPRASGRAAPMGSYELLSAGAKLPADAHLVLDLEGDGTGDPASSIVAAFRGRHVPLDPATNKVVEFNELAKKSTGREALACLKMDVDNLGYVFSQGLKGSPNSSRASDRGGEPDRTSISRVATLSRTLETFFSGYLECLLRGEFSDVYLVYCGGDDLAAIGPWDKVFALALRIREDFRRFTGGNPAWTLSAGIAVTNPGVPVLVALAQAEDFLEASKRLPGPEILPWPSEHSEGDPQKDRLTAFGTSIPWSEYPGVDNQAKRVLRWLEDGTLKTSKVRRLLWFAEMARKFQRTRQTRYLEYLPLLVRELRRNWGEQTESQREARQWAAGLTLPSPEAMRPIRFVCEYALYGIRGKQGD